MVKTPEQCAADLLNLSWFDISHEREGLTDSEKSCVSKKEWPALLKWVHKHATLHMPKGKNK